MSEHEMTDAEWRDMMRVTASDGCEPRRSPAMDIESIVKQAECNTIGIEGKKHDPNFCTRCQLESYATSQRELRKGLCNRITEWLSVGGLFNSEQMGWPQSNADNLRKLLLDCRAILEGKG